MSASKKSKSKSSNSPAPATKAAAKKKTSAPTVQATVAAPVPTPAPTPAPAPAATPIKTVATISVQTTLRARIDVGFGNALFVRGEGPGLSWNKGKPMENVENDLWRIVLPEAARPYTFKFLINDATWSTGPDFTAASGSSITLQPKF